ncbi:MAG: NAD(P)H-dependent oxidoreductase [Sphingomonas sp.]
MSLSPDHYLVLANPSEQSFDHAIAQTYASVVASCGQSADINDLNAMAFDPVLKDDERFDRGDKRSPWIEAELARLSRCGVVVLIYPIWFGGPPAILKGYVDRVLGAHCGVGAFQSGAAQPALRGRHLLSISTSGTSTEWLREHGQPHAVREGFDLYIERGFGLRDAGHLNLDGIGRNMSSAHAAEALVKVAETAKSMCSTLLAG